jgi:hypothetical protein
MGTGADQVQQQLATGTAAYANIKTEHGKGLQPVLANTTGQPLQYIPGSMTGTAASLTRTNSTGTSQASLTNSLQSILNTPGNPTINNTPIAPDAVPGMLNNNQLLTASNPIVMTTTGGLINPISGGTKTFQLANGRAISVPNTPGAPTLPPIQVANNINSNLQQHATNPSNWSEGTKATKVHIDKILIHYTIVKLLCVICLLPADQPLITSRLSNNTNECNYRKEISEQRL